MSKQFKPLLSASIEDTSTIPYPVLVSVKLDGIRALVVDGVVVSRNLKPIRNAFVQAKFGKQEYNGFDGELIVGEPNAHDVYLQTNSGVMSADGEPDVKYHVFDRWDMPETPYQGRYNSIPVATVPEMAGRGLIKVQQWKVDCEQDLLTLEKTILDSGYEGLMARKADGKYKYGRSTLKEFIIAKLKRFADAEYKVIDFQERMHNANEATINALGHTERSTHKENLVGRGDLGALVLETADGLVFTCGTGFTDAQRAEIWANRERYVGSFATVKSFTIGVKDLPRFPVFKAFRDVIDA